LEVSHFCIVDAAGKVVKEARVSSEPEAILAWFSDLGLEMEAIGLEAGPLSQWLYAAMTEAGLPVVLLETRQVRDAFRSMPVKTDRKERMPMIWMPCALIRGSAWRWASCRDRAQDLPASRP
jgi:transposase